jgi:hypothetical protein
MSTIQAFFFIGIYFCKIQNAIKLENISNLITSPSSYQCIRRKTRLVSTLMHFVIHGWHISMTTPLRHLVSTWNDERMNSRLFFKKNFYTGIVQSNLCWKIHNKYVFHVNIQWNKEINANEKKSLYCWHKKKFRKKYIRQPSIDFDIYISSSCDVVYKGRWLTTPLRHLVSTWNDERMISDFF